MTSPTCQDSGPFQEWAPLTTLLQKIPTKIQNGLFTQDVNFTCLDAVADFIAVGTNQGLVYWFDRKTGDLETLGCENANSIITCVQIVSTVDYMVAAGSNHGVVTIFQIPKQHPDSLPETLKPKRKKQVERFNISGLHGVPVTAVEWSKNGMKLFSGDQNGLVVLTEMDFYLHLSKSTELLNEKYSVVQLSYQNGLLLISTLFRTIVVDRNQNSQVTQVGQKERKMLGKLGAVFSKNRSHIQEPIIFASRPGLRIWQADKKGIVVKTLILKEAVKVGQNRVKLLNPASDSLNRKSRGDLTFGIIMPLSDDLLVTYNEDVVYIVNPTAIMITSVVTNLRKVTDIACTEDEIFILEGERNIVRIASYPEITSFDTVPNEPTDQSPIVVSNEPVSWTLTDFTSKLKSSSIVPAIPFHKINPTSLIQSASILPPVIIGIDTTSIINAEEAIEVPPVIPLELDTHLVSEVDSKQADDCKENRNKSIDRKDIFQKIGEQDFEEVVFTPRRKGKKSSEKKSSIRPMQTEKASIDNSDVQINYHQKHKNNILIKSDQSSQSIQKIDKDFILESARNLESIQKAVQDKEKLLSNYLNLDLSKYMDKNTISATNSNYYSSIDSSDYANNSIQYWPADKSQCTHEFASVERKSEAQNCNSKLYRLKDLAECSKKVFETKQIDQQSWLSNSDLEDKKISETDFNELSKEFVKSTIYEDNDDWILLG